MNSTLLNGVPKQYEMQAMLIAQAFYTTFSESPPLWFDWERADVAETVEVNYRRRWWTVCWSSRGEIMASVEGIRRHLAAAKNAEKAAKTDPAPAVDTILQQRGSTHGNFGDNATCALQLRDVMRSMKPHWSNCTAEQRLALEEIALKIARILSGGNKEIDNWNDIQGYAKLGGNACTKNPVASAS